ncbi:TRAP transporter large permease subunit, partial [Pseudorhodoplanes sp.]|uniref:TRAP transporter large permease subunit n=1 Tax=Pseudorhodoplanes sp. TaxID=1934341 RepID=UPI002D028159
MSIVALSLLLIAILLLILASGIWVALGLAAIGLVAMAVTVSTPPGPALAASMWQASNSWDLTALPMFILMGEILYRTKLSEDMFEALAPWMQRLPGRLLHVNVVGCGIFAAVSGSSAATCATIGRISLPELRQRGYDQSMAIGTLAGSGTLGLLIPPSIIMIVYATATDQSIARLFIAGVMPGIMLIVLFMGYIALWALINKER